MIIARRVRQSTAGLASAANPGDRRWDGGNFLYEDWYAKRFFNQPSDAVCQWQVEFSEALDTTVDPAVGTRTLCNLAPGPRNPVGFEIDQWYQAALCGRYGANNWGIANGDRPFATFVAPNGRRYDKFLNGDVVTHNGIGPGQVVIRPDDRCEGSLVSGAGPGIYVIQGGRRCGIPDPETFEKLGFKWDSVVRISDAALAIIPEGPTLPTAINLAADGSLLVGSAGAVFLVQGGQRHWVPDPETFDRLGLDAAAIRTVTDAQLATVPDGFVLPSIRSATQGIGMRGPVDIPTGIRPANWYGVGEDDLRVTFELIKKLFTRTPGGGTTQPGAPTTSSLYYVTEILRPFNDKAWCDTTIDGKTVSVPCDLLPGPRDPTAQELDQWWAAAAVDRFGNIDWGVANGTKGFSSFYAPDGELYIKYYNGDTVQHRDRPPNKLVYKRSTSLFDYVAGAITDVAGFIAQNICLIAAGGAAAATGGNVQVALAAKNACDALKKAASSSDPPVLTLPSDIGEGSLIKGSSPALYVIHLGQRHLIPDQETLTALQLSLTQIHVVEDAVLNAFPLGPPVPSVRAPTPGYPPTGMVVAPAATVRPWYLEPWVLIAAGVGAAAVVVSIGRGRRTVVEPARQ